MSFPWIHESEIEAARAEAEADIPLTGEDRVDQRRLDGAYDARPGQGAETGPQADAEAGLWPMISPNRCAIAASGQPPAPDADLVVTLTGHELLFSCIPGRSRKPFRGDAR